MKTKSQQILKQYHSEKFTSYPLGLQYEDPRRAVHYFCTPVGAQIFASIGVDGVHYCIVPKLGEMVFAVTPDALEPYVFPVANNFEEFLRLVAALRGTNLIDQAHLFSKERFEALRQEQPNTNEDEAKRLCETFEITPLEGSPYDLLMDLYNNFDYSMIKFSREYYETLGL